MRLFELRTDLTSYFYPATKIIICLLVIVFSIVRKRIFLLSNFWINAVITALCFVFTIASVLCLYISVSELFYTYANRTNIKSQLFNTTNLSMNTVIEIALENDIVEIEVTCNNTIIKIGSSADCKYSSSVFENKMFYISNSEYKSIDLFTERLKELFPSGTIPVSKIDGLPLKYWGKGDGLREP